MIEGTRPYRGRQNFPEAEKKPADTVSPAKEEIPVAAAATSETPQADAANLGRRAWFGALVPQLGEGLVKLLRAGNNLQHDLQDLQSPHMPQSENQSSSK